MAKKKNIKEDTTVKESKKYNTFQVALVVLLTALILVLCIVLVAREVSTMLDHKKLMEEFNTTYESEDLSIIFYNATGCHYCELQKPILEQIAKDYNIEYLNLDKMNLSESQVKEVNEKLGIEGATPTTVVVQSGKVVATKVGYVTGNKYVDFFVEAGVLPEGSKYVPEENLTFIDYNQFLELQASKKTVVVTIGKATCEYCTTARPILSNLAKAYNIPIYYITLDYISAEDRIALVEELEGMDYQEETFVEEGNFVTPTVLIIQNNKVVSYAAGLGNITSYTKLFKETGVISE